MLLQCGKYGATGFVRVCAIAKAALLAYLEYLAEVMSHLFALHIEGTKALDAGGVYDVAGGLTLGVGEVEHLGEGGGVHTRVVRVRNLCRAHIQPRYHGIEQGALAHTAIAGEERGLAVQYFSEGFYATEALLIVEGRDTIAGITDAFVETEEELQEVLVFLVEKVHLVEDEDYGHTVCLGSSQETVYEGGAGFGMAQCHHEGSLVHIGRDDVALLGEVGSLADDIIATLVNLGNKSRLAVVLLDGYAIAHGNGVGGADASQAKVALHLAFYDATVVGAHLVKIACVLDYDSVHG